MYMYGSDLHRLCSSSASQRRFSVSRLFNLPNLHRLQRNTNTNTNRRVADMSPQQLCFCTQRRNRVAKHVTRDAKSFRSVTWRRCCVWIWLRFVCLRQREISLHLRMTTLISSDLNLIIFLSGPRLLFLFANDGGRWLVGFLWRNPRSRCWNLLLFMPRDFPCE